MFKIVLVDSNDASGTVNDKVAGSSQFATLTDANEFIKVLEENYQLQPGDYWTTVPVEGV